MSPKTTAVVSFLAGAAAGFFIACSATKKQCEERIQTEVNEISKRYHDMHSRGHAEAKVPESSEQQIEETYSSLLKKYSYVAEEEPEDVHKNDMHIIRPDEFGDTGEYEEVSFTLYSDGVLADEQDHALNAEEIAATVGKDSLNHFGEYEEDSVFVRNDGLKMDIEILKDYKSYETVLKERPYLAP